MGMGEGGLLAACHFRCSPTKRTVCKQILMYIAISLLKKFHHLKQYVDEIFFHKNFIREKFSQLIFLEL